MSAIARYFHESGLIVSGYDKTETTLTKKLVEEGIKISYVDQIEILDKDYGDIFTEGMWGRYFSFHWRYSDRLWY